MIRTISIDLALPLRQTVLWQGHPPSHAMVPGDDTAQHFGLFHDNTLVSVASLFPDDHSGIQLRKFATLPHMQSKGFGRRMLDHLRIQAQNAGATCLWCDARLSARGFYAKSGFQEKGEIFERKGRPYIVMSHTLNKATRAPSDSS
ncbi:GNAT family N-acetyltransferase [Halocynthiibacter sp.]|uniref:GNAT family N-acetyltransferase n=1 Tax=Halocynthiibacter sp. TaxID=1979210 RepID=UPI003C48075A